MVSNQRRLRVSLLAIALGIAAVAAFPSAAGASQVSIDGAGVLTVEGDGIDGTVEPNDVTIGQDALIGLLTQFTIQDIGTEALVAVPPCVNDPATAPDVAVHAICLDPLDGVTRILVNGKAGEDKVIIDSTIGISATLNGGDGNDELTGGPASDTVDGGDGDDILRVRDGMQDTVTCDDGADTVFADASDADAPDVFNDIANCEIIDYLGPPNPPTITGSVPESPHNDNNPRIQGTAEAGTTVDLYIGPDCTDDPVATDSAEKFNSPGLTVNVANDTTTEFSATTTDLDSEVSACSTPPFTYVEDSRAPRVIDGGVLPEDGAVDVAIDANVEVTFSEAMSQPATEEAFSLKDESGNNVSGTFEWNGAGDEMMFDPEIDLVTGTEYAASVGTDAADVAGNTLDGEKTWTFTTAGPDSTPPGTLQITATNPPSPSSDSNPKVKGTVGTGNPTQVRLYTNASCEGSADATGDVADFVAGGVAVSVPDNSTTLLSARAVDAADNESSCSNSIDYVEDSTDPTITAVLPAENATNVATDTNIEVTFSEPMKQTETQNGFSLIAEGDTTVMGTHTWNVAGNNMTFDPATDLDPGTDYTASVGAGAQDLASNPIEDKNWSFTIAAEPEPARPDNDDFVGAAPLVDLGDEFFSADGTNEHATKEPGELLHAGNAGGASVWYTWTAPSAGEVFLDTCRSDFDTLLAVYVGETMALLSKVRANDDSTAEDCGDGPQSSVRFRTPPDIQYMIAVDGFNSGSPEGPEQGSVGLNLTLIAPPPNDLFANAEDLVSDAGGNASMSGTNKGAMTEPGEPTHAVGNNGGASVWYRWTAPASGHVFMDTCDSGFDTILAVYTGAVLNALTQLVSSDLPESEECENEVASEVEFDAEAGVTYQIAIDGWEYESGPDEGDFVLALYGPAPVSSGDNPDEGETSGNEQNDPQTPRSPADDAPEGKLPVDTRSPQTGSLKLVQAAGGHGPVFRFGSDEEGVTFQCMVAAQRKRGKSAKTLRKQSKPRWVTCTSPYRPPKLAPGKYVFQVRAVDEAGNVDLTPARKAFTVPKKKKGKKKRGK